MHELLGIQEFISESIRDCPRNLLPRSKVKIRIINNIGMDCSCVCQSDHCWGRESPGLGEKDFNSIDQYWSAVRTLTPIVSFYNVKLVIDDYISNLE